MSVLEILILAVGLSMDAFAVSICKGLAVKRIDMGKAGIVGLWFGGFQALMPMIGYFLGSSFSNAIQSVDHWVAFILLSLIGANMIREALSRDEDAGRDSGSLSFKTMLILAVATSIDALAAGITFAFLDVNIVSAVSIIGCTTCIISMAGAKVGSVFGTKYKSKAELTGGVMLILLGLKILLEHTGILADLMA
ncbi:MAG: manganese efflux pump MntP family protein [Christensenellales bacterium]